MLPTQSKNLINSRLDSTIGDSVEIRSSVFLAVGLIVLFFALFSNFFVSVGVFDGESYHVVVILEANPDRYFDFMKYIVLYGILPIATSLTLCIIAYVKEREILTKRLENWLMLTVGGFCFLFGSLYFQAAYRSYFHAIEFTNRWEIGYISSSLRSIYMAYGLIGVLWLIIGIFFIITSAYRIHELRKAS